MAVNQSSKLLVVGPSWVGDMVMAQRLFIELSSRAEVEEVHVLAPPWAAPIVERMPQIQQHIAADFKHGELALRRRWQLAKSLRARGYTHCIVLPNSIKAALVPFMAGIPVRTGWLGEQRWGLLTDIRRLDKGLLPTTVQRFMALAQPSGAEPVALNQVTPPRLVADHQQALSLVQRLGCNNLDRPVLALCPGAEFGASKQWPAHHYAELARYYLDRDWHVWLVGSANDASICAQIDAQSDQQCHDLSGKTSLPEAVDLLSLASLVVSNDSGLMHIAAALNRPLVAIYGSTDPHHTPPLGKNHAIARLALDCSPCFKRECPLQHLDCLHKLEPKSVIALAQSVM